MVMVLYESKVLLVSFICCVICFCPTDERTSVRVDDKGKPELLLRIIFLCVAIPLVVCLSEINASESSSNLIQHASGADPGGGGMGGPCPPFGLEQALNAEVYRALSACSYSYTAHISI